MLHDALIVPVRTVFTGITHVVGGLVGVAQTPFCFFLVMLVVPLGTALFQREPD